MLQYAHAGPPRGEPAFPAGLIPHLVNERLKTEPPYTPLDARDIERTTVQPPAEPSAYIQSRIEKFKAELQVPALVWCWSAKDASVFHTHVVRKDWLACAAALQEDRVMLCSSHSAAC